LFQRGSRDWPANLLSGWSPLGTLEPPESERMMTRSSALVLLSIFAMGGMSCARPMPGAGVGDSGNRSEAERFVRNVLSIYRRDEPSAPSPPAAGSAAELDYFRSMDIVDASGEPLRFDDLSADQRTSFFEEWAKHTAELLREKLDEDPRLVPFVQARNEAIEAALSSSSPATAADLERFTTAYRRAHVERMKKLSSQQTTGSLRDKSASQTFSKLKSNFRVGRVLSSLGPSSSSDGSALGLGHAAVLTEGGSWDPRWDTNHSMMISTSAWGIDTEWNDGKYKVTKEPLGLWLNEYSSTPVDVVSLYKVGTLTFVFDWFNSHYEWSDAPRADRLKARDFARSKLGLPYNFNVLNKWATDSYYCSQLVWASWYETDHKYDIDAIPWDTWVSAADIMNSDKVRRVFASTN